MFKNFGKYYFTYFMVSPLNSSLNALGDVMKLEFKQQRAILREIKFKRILTFMHST